MIGPPFTSAHRLRDCLPYLTWQVLKSEFSRQYSKILFNSHANQAFAHLQQGPDDLLEMHLHHASELLSKIHDTTHIAQIPTKHLSCYTVVYDLNSAKWKVKVVEYQSAYWNTMEDCFGDIHVFGAGYERAKGYSRADFDAPDALKLVVESTKEPGTCFKCGELHFQNKSTKNKGHSSSKFQKTVPTSSIKIIVIAVRLWQVLYTSRHHSKLSQVMTYH